MEGSKWISGRIPSWEGQRLIGFTFLPPRSPGTVLEGVDVLMCKKNLSKQTPQMAELDYFFDFEILESHKRKKKKMSNISSVKALWHELF